MNNNSSKQILLSVLGVAILVVAVVGVSFAAFTYTKPGTQVNEITTGTITLSYTEGADGIKLENALPITKDAGKKLAGENEYFDFTVDAKVAGKTTIDYSITAAKVTPTSTLADSDVMLYLETINAMGAEVGAADEAEAMAPKVFTPEKAANTNTGRPANEMVLEEKTITASQTKYYRLRMWVAADAADQFTEQKTFQVKVNVYAKAEQPAAD